MKSVLAIAVVVCGCVARNDVEAELVAPAPVTILAHVAALGRGEIAQTEVTNDAATPRLLTVQLERADGTFACTDRDFYVSDSIGFVTRPDSNDCTVLVTEIAAGQHMIVVYGGLVDDLGMSLLTIRLE